MPGLRPSAPATRTAVALSLFFGVFRLAGPFPFSRPTTAARLKKIPARRVTWDEVAGSCKIQQATVRNGPRTEETAMLEVNHHLRIPENELEWSFVRSGGPGGQNV